MGGGGRAVYGRETFLSFAIATARHFKCYDLRADVSGLFQVKCAHASVN
jgi:hypothetical protein